MPSRLQTAVRARYLRTEWGGADLRACCRWTNARPKSLFGGERIMGLTPLGKVPRARIAALRMRVHVVLLQKSGLSAPLTLVVDKCAARSVAIPHFAAYLR